MLQEILKKFWGYDDFRLPQLDIIHSLLKGQDTLAILPTGGGKSLCFQLPSVAVEGVTLVVAPLIALMKDQVFQLKKRGIPAAYLAASNSEDEQELIIQNAINGSLKLLYVAPERLLSQKFLSSLAAMPISFIAIDEAHCISQWGHDFRPSYRLIAQVFQYIKRVPIIALTASATTQVQDDISKQLGLRSPNVFKESVVRKNLSYRVIHAESKLKALEQLLEEAKHAAIVYCSSRKQTEVLALHLRRFGIDTQAYHAGMHPMVRDKIQEEWSAKHNQVICATAAFGMGIDKPDVRQVIHWDIPMNLEAYYQEAGRAGRDGTAAQCTLLYHFKDADYLMEISQDQFPSISFIKSIYQKVMNYLSITIGEGLEGIYPFKVAQFIQQYQLPMRPTLAAIKLLQKNSFWQWNESDALHSKLMFTVDKYSIEQLLNINKNLGAVTQTILRMYGGVFYFPTWINEFDIAKKMGIPKLELDVHLKQLQHMEFIHYTPASDGGTLFMLSERLPENYVNLNEKLLLQLKKEHYFRLDQMLQYINQTKVCRNQYLAQYFGETKTQDCGSCDICLAKNVKTITPKAVRDYIASQLVLQERLKRKEVENYFGAKYSRQIIEYLRLWIDEGWIKWDKEDDIIQLKSK